jgi:uncharacterized damage-inducible protein DinB
VPPAYFLAKVNYLGLVHGVTVRAIGGFSDEDLGFRPAASMRSPRELVYHIYAQERAVAEAARSGAFEMAVANRCNPEDPSAASELAKLERVSDVVAYAKACHDIADAIWRAISDEDLKRPIPSPFGTHPPSRFFDFAYDEHWHHRGQLYTYLRLLGKQPTDLYGYG